MDYSESSSDLQVKRLSLIDFSSEDDSLLFVRPTDDLFDPSSSADSVTEDNFELPEDGPQPLQIQSTEPERVIRNGKINLRKSLAWDSAFFTSAGVLEPEELSSMIDGVDKHGKHVLCGIPEDVQKSTDSLSTLASDSLTVESMEANLFEDLRASIQKSSGVRGLVDSTSKAKLGLQEPRKMPPSRRIEVGSQNKMQGPASKRTTINGMEVQGKIIKKRHSSPNVLQQPKIQCKLPPSSTTANRRVSLNHNSATVEKGNTKTASEKGASGLKRHTLSNPRNVAPKPTSAAKKEKSSSFDSCGSSSSGNIGKSLFSSTERKTDSMTSNPHSYGFTHKTPSRVVGRVKSQPGDSRLSTFLMSMSKHSSGTSPASSISEWSTESSPSSTLEQRSSSSRASMETSSSKSLSVGNDAPKGPKRQYHSNDRSPGGEIQILKRASIGTAALPPPLSAKPSGLRLPSPKIGFFDGSKSIDKSSPVLSGGPPKFGAGNLGTSGSLNKAKHGKLQPSRMALKSTKPVYQKNSLHTSSKSPKPVQKSSNRPVKVSDAPSDLKTAPGLSSPMSSELSPNNLNAKKLGGEECDFEYAVDGLGSQVRAMDLNTDSERAH